MKPVGGGLLPIAVYQSPDVLLTHCIGSKLPPT
ncbi:hypothetical protein C4K03_0287 [Pseudomonas synxantha]|uniref:Uncharacterized protein n=1 Tax=Pseudomonas synxantha TaxID=47883 RepID=A0A3G7TZC4_9PSED|nr:hypothetical protein C4K03_0287 [Pseudomonas synxantha]